jgi:hypothetical protein
MHWKITYEAKIGMNIQDHPLEDHLVIILFDHPKEIF